jgi:hypothetical protein
MIQHEYSRANIVYMDEKEKLAALRFMLSMPLEKWFGISALPNYVFDFIYEVGTLLDLPWIRFLDDDTGQRIMRLQHTQNPVTLAKMLWSSPLFIRMQMDDLIRMAYHEQIGVVQFENYLLKYLKRWQGK